MKTCKRCGARLEYVEAVRHKCYTVKEWKRFAKFTDDIVDGQSMTMQEILLGQYDIFLIDHQSRHDGKFIKVPLKERMKGGLRSLPSKITQKNFDKGMETFDKGMESFSKEMDALSKGLGGNDKNKPKLWSDKKTDNIELLIGKKPVQKKKKKTQDEQNMEKIWGKRK